MDLRRRESWLLILLYALFLFAPISIVGITAATILLFCLVVYHRFREPVRDVLPPWVIAAFLLLPCAAVISALANPEPLANIAILRREYAFFLPLALLSVLDTADRKRLLLVFAAPVMLAALYGVIQYFWGVDWFRAEGHKLITPAQEPGSTVFHGKGTFSHHLTFVGFMAINVPFFLALAGSERGKTRLYFSSAALMAILGTLVSLGRSGWLGATAGVLLWLLGFPRRIVIPVAALAIMLAVAGISVYEGWLTRAIPYELQPGFVKRLVMTSIEKDDERLYIWQAALLGIRERPWLGVGYGNDDRYAPLYRKIVSEAENFQFRVKTEHAHNVYLQVAFELGLVGFLAYLYLWGTMFIWNRHWLLRAEESMRFERALLAGASCGLVASMVAGFFENNFFDAEVRTLILIMMGLSLHAGLEIRRSLGETGGEPQAFPVDAAD